MNFSRFFISRPIFATVLSILIVLVGSIAYVGLPISQYPEVAPPTIVVSATYPGANAKVVSETVATPIEQEVNGVEDMLYMSSQSTNDGVMTLTVTFKLGTDLNKAQVLVQNRVAIAEARLPEEARRLGITTTKQSPDLSLVIHLISPKGTYDQLYLANYATLQVKDEIARVPGVGAVRVFGGGDYAMRVWLDPRKLRGRELTATDVTNAIREQNVQVAAGTLGKPPNDGTNAFQLTVTTQGRLSTKEEFEDIVIKTGAGGEIVHLRDVARVEVGAADYSLRSYLSGTKAVALPVFQLPGSNALAMAKQVKETMARLSKRFPADLEFRVAYDTSVFVEESVEAVKHTLFEAILLVVLVVVVFLQNWRTSIIPLLAVPVSLIGTFAIMQLLGFSLNNLSLFGLVLAIGIVVDDAIVVVENVERNIALGKPPRQATEVAMGEVAGPVVATALVLSAVFIPTAFISGISGQFYRQFALTIAVSTVISAFNSLTLSPALTALLLKDHHAKKDIPTRIIDLLLGWFFRLFNAAFALLTRVYAGVVGGLVRAWPVTLAAFGGLLWLTVVMFRVVPGGFIPLQDQGYLIVVGQLPDAASLDRSDALRSKMSKILMETPGVIAAIEFTGYSGLTGATSSNAITVFARLAPFEQRRTPELRANGILAKLAPKLGAIQEGLVLAIPPPPVRGIGNAGGFKLQLQDRGGLGPGLLQKAAYDLIGAAKEAGGMTGFISTFRGAIPQVFLDIDRAKAKTMGVPLGNVFDTLQVYLGSAYVNDFNILGRTYRVTAQADAPFRMQKEDVGVLETRNRAGEMVPLGTLLTARPSVGPDIVSRYNQFPSADVSGNTLPGFSSGQAIAKMQELAAKTLPGSMTFEWTELSLQQILAGNTAIYIFPLCVLLVFLTLAAQYESWGLPLAVILIVPMGLLSAIVGVWAAGQDNNIFTQIGLVVLIGLACKNAILVVEFAKAKQDEGMEPREAVLEACRLRLRPILMTSFAFILGVLPLARASGAGAEMRRALGVTVLSGMIGVTFFGLLFTPVFYYVIAKAGAKRPAATPGETAPDGNVDEKPVVAESHPQA